jgi:hypothetical protein
MCIDGADSENQYFSSSTQVSRCDRQSFTHTICKRKVYVRFQAQDSAQISLVGRKVV